MKKLMLGMVVATGLAVAVAGQSSAASLTSCDMSQAILEAETAINEVGGVYSTLSDAKGVSIREHVKYLQERVEIAKRLVNGDESVRYPEELYATVTEGTRALKLITGTVKGEARQTTTSKTTAPGATQTVAQTVVAKAPKVAQASSQTAQAKLAVAEIETDVSTSEAKLASLAVGTRVAAPEETAGVDREIEVPATGEVDTEELEKILMTIGVASAVGMLGLAGICAVIGRR